MNQGRIRVLALALADAICVGGVWSLLVNAYQVLGYGNYRVSDYYDLWPIVPLFIGINAVSRLYHGNWMYPATPLSPVEEFRRLFASSIFAHLLLMSVLGFSRHNLDYSRFIIGVSGVVVGLLAQLARDLMRLVLYKLHIGQIPVALAGDSLAAKRIAAVLANDHYVGFEIVLTFDDDHLRDIVPESRKHDVKILLACQNERYFRVQLREFAAWFNYIEYIPSSETFPVFGSHAISVDGVGGLEMMNQGRMKALKWEKRILDYLLAIFALLVTSPLFLVIPLIIKLTSKGPVFYVANRLGRRGEPFKIIKFRSMYADADKRLMELLANNPDLKDEWKKQYKLRNDPRITRIGRILRKTSLDELPQIFNVFKGDMSFVGPRPIVENEKAYYGKDYEVFARARPGITGLWQCRGRSDVDYVRRVSLDVYYILNWSPWMDVWICLRTVIAVVTMKGSV